MADFDAIVSGAGIWGCTVARRLAEAAKSLNLVMGVRLGHCKYFDMDKAMAAALETPID